MTTAFAVMIEHTGQRGLLALAPCELDAARACRRVREIAQARACAIKTWYEPQQIEDAA